MDKAAETQELENPNAGGDAAAAAGAGADKAAGQDAGAAGGDGTQGAPQIYRPEGLPDHFAGATDQETIDKLYKAVDGFRTAQAKKGIPETADGYDLKLADDVKQKVLRPGEDGKDPVFEAMKGIAHKHNLSNDAFSDMAGELYKTLAEMAGAGGGDAAADDLGDLAPDFDFKSAGGIEKAQADIDAANLWIGKLETDGTVDKTALDELKNMTTYAQGVHTLKALRIASGEKAIPKNPGKDAPANLITDEMIEERHKDPRSWRTGDIDDAYIAETKEMVSTMLKQQGRK